MLILNQFWNELKEIIGKIIFLAVLVTKLYVLIIVLTSQLFFAEEKMQSINLLKQFLRSIVIADK